MQPDTAVTRSAAPPRSDWRLREADLFDRLGSMMEGLLPDPLALSCEGLRRDGYLADLAVFFLKPRNADALREFAGAVMARLKDALGPRAGWAPLPLLPAHRASTASLCAVERKWAVVDGIDVARYRAERGGA